MLHHGLWVSQLGNQGCMPCMCAMQFQMPYDRFSPGSAHAHDPSLTESTALSQLSNKTHPHGQIATHLPESGLVWAGEMEGEVVRALGSLDLPLLGLSLGAA
eukprot:1162076-Pelagomonas_calceolata.AAC.8